MFSLMAANILVMAVAVAASGEKVATAQEEAASPNILYIVVDDADVENMNKAFPNTAAAVRDAGAEFTNFYVPESTCCPSRASLLLGEYPHNTRVESNDPLNGGWEVFRQRGQERRAWTRRVCPPKGGRSGRAQPDRGKPGSKCHVLTDRNGVPLAVVLTAANVHASKVFEELADAVGPVKRPGKGRPRRRPEKLHAYKAYDFRCCRAVLRRRGIKSRIARRGKDASERLGRYRWVVERTLA